MTIILTKGCREDLDDRYQSPDEIAMIELSPEKQKELDQHLIAAACILYKHTASEKLKGTSKNCYSSADGSLKP
jgi:hypothetical protein